MASQIDRARGVVGNQGFKTPCLLTTTSNIALSAEQTIDGVLTFANRVLVKNQTLAVQNGIYVSSSGNWAREPDFDGELDIVQGTLVVVASGSTNFRTVWELTTASPVIGTSPITFKSWLGPRKQSLIDGAIISWDVSEGAMGVVTLNGNRTMAAPTGLREGEAYALVIYQDVVVGSRLLTWSTSYKWPGGTAPTLSTAIGAKDILSFICENGVLNGVAQKAFG